MLFSRLFPLPRASSSVLSGGMLALLIACGGGNGASNGGKAPTTSRTVKGAFSYIRLYGTTESVSPRDLSNATVAGLVAEGSGYRTIVGTGKADGTFTIPDLPTSAGWVRIQEPGTTFSRFIWTDASQLNLNFNIMGDPAIPLSASNSTRLRLDPGAWEISVSSMDILSSKVGFSASLTTSSWPGTFSWYGKPLLNKSRDTDLIITGISSGMTASGDTYSWISGYAQSVISPFAMQDGVTNDVLANLVIQGTPLSTSTTVDRDTFTRGNFNPRTESGMQLITEYRAQFLGALWGPISGAQARILTHSTATLTGTLDTGQLVFGDPFPPSWTRLVRVAYSSYVPFTIGTGTAAYTLYFGVGTTSTWKTEARPSGSLAALVGPLGNLKANGQSLMTPLTGQGTTPLLTWEAPTVGQATSYGIWVINLDTFEVLAHFTTPLTSLQMPAGVIPSGARSLIWISADRRVGGYDTANPYASSWPYGSSSVVSEPYVP